MQHIYRTPNEPLSFNCITDSDLATFFTSQETEWKLQPLQHNQADLTVDLGVGLGLGQCL